NAYDPRGDYGRCISDAPSQFNGYVVYDLPFGKGKRFGSHAGDVKNAFIGGWSVASIVTLHSGFAITALGPDSSGTNSASPRANCPSGVSQEGSHQIVPLGGGQFGMQFWNPLSATPGTPGTFGTCKVGSFRGPGLATADLSVMKSFAFSERANLDFIAQFFNVTNRPIYGRPNFFQGPNFGVITSSNPGREVQLGIKLTF